MRFLPLTALLLGGSVALGGCTSTSITSGYGSALGAYATTGDERPLDTALMAAMGGGLVGSIARTGLGERERRTALEAEYRALEYTPTGQPVTWRAADGSLSGQVVAASPYRVGSQDCRQYVHTLSTRAGTDTARGTACRNADGSWSLLG